MSIASKLEYLDGTKDYIRQCIQQKGVTVDSSTTFREYGDKILEIDTEKHPDGWPGEGEGTGLLTTGTATATGKDYVLDPPIGYDGFNKVNVTGDYNLKPENIVEGITIYGVTGTMKLNTNMSNVPTQYVDLLEMAKTYYQGDYSNLMILEADEAVAFGFLLSDFNVDNYDKSNTEFFASNWVYVAYNKKTGIWKTEPWQGITSNGNSYISNIRYCDRYIYYGDILIYPMISRPDSLDQIFRFEINISESDAGKIARWISATGDSTLRIEFGDGTQTIDSDIGTQHMYAKAGVYTITAHGPLYSINAGANAYRFIDPLPASILDLTSFSQRYSNTSSNKAGYVTVPVNLFSLQESVVDITGLFSSINFSSTLNSGVTSLISLPPGVFSSFKNVIRANDLFYDCTKLSDIPEDLFSVMTKLQYLKNAFYNTRISKIPDHFFDACVELLDVSAIFSDCTLLSSIPSKLFSNCKKLVNYNSAFQDCIGLTEISDDIFPKSDVEISCNQMFSGCTGLHTIPPNLFDNVEKVSNITRMFSGCKNIIGPLPELWNDDRFKDIPHQNCFYNCTNASNYVSVPTGWR